MTRAVERMAATFLALVVCVVRVDGQAIDRSKRPAVPPAATFEFPKVQAHTLSNGLRLIVVEDHSLPLVVTRVVVGVDSTADPVGKEGLYAVTLGALREGTVSKSVDELAAAFADIGSTVTPTGFTTTTSGFAPALALTAEMLIHPLLDQAGVERRKELQAANARRVLQIPSAVPRHLFYALLYGADDPYVRSLVPTESSIAAVTRDDVARFYQENFQPQTTTVIVAGDVSDAAATATVTRLFSGWRGVSRSDKAVTTGRLPSPRPTTIYLHNVPGTQAYVYVGGIGPARTSPDFFAVETMGVISGTRMQQTLRDRRSIMYSGNSGVIWRRAPQRSSVVGSTAVNATKVDSALVEWLSLLRGLGGGQPVTPRELDATRRSRVGVLRARIDGPDSLAARVAEMVRDNVPLDFYDRYANGMASVTAGDVAAAASKYVDSGHLIIVVSGERSAIEPVLRAANMAPVVIVDANGKPIDR